MKVYTMNAPAENTPADTIQIKLHESEALARILAIRQGETIGALDLRKSRPNWWEAYHTFVSPESRGSGVAGKMFDELVSWARENQYKIIPSCSYVEKKFDEPGAPVEVLAS